jgi:predicted  nucleic acid-binding Zn-ribbon protein
MFKAGKATKGERICALENRCERMEREGAAFKKDMHGLMEEIADLFEGQQQKIAALEAKVAEMEAKVAELEAKRVPVISYLTGGKKEKPGRAKQIMDEWFNGKAEGGEGK